MKKIEVGDKVRLVRGTYDFDVNGYSSCVEAGDIGKVDWIDENYADVWFGDYIRLEIHVRDLESVEDLPETEQHISVAQLREILTRKLSDGLHSFNSDSIEEIIRAVKVKISNS